MHLVGCFIRGSEYLLRLRTKNNTFFLTKASLLLVITKKNEGLRQQVRPRISWHGSRSAGQAW